MKSLKRQSYLLSKAILFLALLVLSACTREAQKTTQIKIKLPEAAKLISKLRASNKISGQAAGAWQVADPTTLQDILCYAVAVEWAESTENTCADSSGNAVLHPGMFYGAIPAGKEITLDVPAGPARKIYLIGFAATDISYCYPYISVNGPPKANLSAPHILATHKMDLAKGVTHEVEMFASVDSTKKFSDCKGPLFEVPGSSNPPETISVTIVSPIAGDTLLTGSLSNITVSGTCSEEGQNVNLTGAAANTAVCTSGSFSTTLDFTAATDGNVSVCADHANVAGDISVQDCRSFIKDTVAPTVTVEQASSQSDPSSMSPVVFDVIFSEPVNGFSSGAVNLGGSATATFTVSGTSSSAVYAVSVDTVSVDGTLIPSISSGVVSDLAGNLNSVSSSTDNTVTFDSSAPASATALTWTETDPTNLSSINANWTISGSVDLAGQNIQLYSDASCGTPAGAEISLSSAVATQSFAGVTNGITYSFRVKSIDTASLFTWSTCSSPITIDSVGPTVTINQQGGADPTNSSSISFDVVFSESVTGFSGAGLTIGGTATGGIANVAGSGALYTVTINSLSSAGSVIPTVNAGAATDAAGNGTSTSTSTDNTVIFDNIAPTVTVEQAGGQVDPANALPVVFDVTFSESVTGFTIAGVSITGSVTSPIFNITGSGASYQINVTSATSDGTIVPTVSVSAAYDLAGNGNSASTSSDNSVEYDSTAPLSATALTWLETNPQNTTSVTASWTKSVSADLGNQKIQFYSDGSCGTPSGVEIDLLSTATVNQGLTGSDGGTYSFIVRSLDLAGNQTLSSCSAPMSIDTTSPGVTINQANNSQDCDGVGGLDDQFDPTNLAPILYCVQFDEAVTGFVNGDVDFSGTTASGTPAVTITDSGDNMLYLVSVTGITGEGLVVANIIPTSIIDSAGNLSAASTFSDNTVTFDDMAPSVTVEQAASQSDPTDAFNVEFDITFNEPVIGFSPSSVTMGGTASAPTFTVSGAGASYKIHVTNSGLGTLIPIINASAVTDLAGNPNSASTSIDNTVTIATIAPSAYGNGSDGNVTISTVENMNANTSTVTDFEGDPKYISSARSIVDITYLTGNDFKLTLGSGFVVPDATPGTATDFENGDLVMWIIMSSMGGGSVCGSGPVMKTGMYGFGRVIDANAGSSYISLNTTDTLSYGGQALPSSLPLPANLSALRQGNPVPTHCGMQAIRVPEFNILTFNDGTLNANPYSAALGYGGVAVVKVKTTIDMNATTNTYRAFELSFRGYDGGNTSNLAGGGVEGRHTASALTKRGNGGGGGNSQGGGGGGNGGAGGAGTQGQAGDSVDTIFACGGACSPTSQIFMGGAGGGFSTFGGGVLMLYAEDIQNGKFWASADGETPVCGTQGGGGGAGGSVFLQFNSINASLTEIKIDANGGDGIGSNICGASGWASGGGGGGLAQINKCSGAPVETVNVIGGALSSGSGTAYSGIGGYSLAGSCL